MRINLSLKNLIISIGLVIIFNLLLKQLTGSFQNNFQNCSFNNGTLFIKRISIDK